eukprot:TRINITY_DN38689_c0_g1_i1.p1 TRINITY_DN38689_c0_g1~~TRINITY_DN38689_c0_g1_i1.p1  ORF type:complete len:257 (+),score=20.40 TRINITY_DN38689_c0_g1_i1:90-860(+)
MIRAGRLRTVCDRIFCRFRDFSSFPLQTNAPKTHIESKISTVSCMYDLSRLTRPWFQEAFQLIHVREVKTSGAEVKIGNIIERKGKMHQVVKTQHTQQGRGGAVIQVELRDVQTGLKSSERLRTTESVERVFVDDKPCTFLYRDGDQVVLMESATFEQMNVPVSFFGEAAVYLTDGMDVTLQVFNGQPLAASVPGRLTCKVVEAEPYFKGQTVTSTYKKVTLENGQVIQVPGFVVTGDEIVVDTATHSYVTRAKGD